MARASEIVLKGNVRSLGRWKEQIYDLRELGYEKREIMQIEFWRYRAPRGDGQGYLKECGFQGRGQQQAQGRCS